MYTRDTVIRVIIELEAGAVIPIIRRDYFNDDDVLDFSRMLDEGSGMRMQGEEDLALLQAATDFANQVVVPHIESTRSIENLTSIDAAAVAKTRIDAEAVIAESANLVRGLEE